MSHTQTLGETTEYFEEEVRDEAVYVLRTLEGVDPEEVPEEEISVAADIVGSQVEYVEPVLSALEVKYGDVSEDEVRNNRLHLKEHFKKFQDYIEELEEDNSEVTSYTEVLAELEDRGYIPLERVCKSDELPFPYDIMESTGADSWDEVIENVNEEEGTEFKGGRSTYGAFEVLGTLTSNRHEINSKIDAITMDEAPNTERFYDIRWEDGLEEALDIAGVNLE